jgi:hypothetical protein
LVTGAHIPSSARPGAEAFRGLRGAPRAKGNVGGGPASRRLAGLRRNAGLALALALACLPGACSATGEAPSGDRLLVRLYDAKHQLRLELSSESNPDLAGVYSQERPDASLKLAPDILMSHLVEDLDRLGFAELSAPVAPPSGGVRGWVEVRRNGSSRTFTVPASNPTADELTAFSHMLLAMNEYYASVGSLQYIDNPQGAALLKGDAATRGGHGGGK